VGFGIVERLLHHAAGDSPSFELRGDFRVMDAHHAVDEVVIRDAQAAFHRGFETARRGVVANVDDGVRFAIAEPGTGFDRSVLQGSWILPPPYGPPGGSAPACGITSEDEAWRRISAISCIAWATPSFAALA